MIVKNLDNIEVKWIIGSSRKSKTRPRSSLHLTARKILQEKFPTFQILEEVRIPVKNGVTLYLDFFIPLRKLAVEVHGQQHYTRTPFFQKTHKDFLQQLRNDQMKEEWCNLNSIELLVLSFDTEDKWTETFYTNTEQKKCQQKTS